MIDRIQLSSRGLFASPTPEPAWDLPSGFQKSSPIQVQLLSETSMDPPKTKERLKPGSITDEKAHMSGQSEDIYQTQQNCIGNSSEQNAEASPDCRYRLPNEADPQIQIIIPVIIVIQLTDE